MQWLIRAGEIAALMFGTDVLWLSWGWYQRWKFKQVQRMARAAVRKKKRLPRLVPARIPKRRG